MIHNFGTLNPTASGNLTVGHSTQSTSATTGAIVTPGGIGVGANITVGGNANILGNTTISNVLFVGASAPLAYSSFSAASIIALNAGATYTQTAMKNSTNTGSADFAAYCDTGTDAGGWVDLGFTGTAFNDPNYTITKPNDGYVLSRSVSTTYGGNLVLATSEAGNFNDIVFAQGSFLATSEVARFHGNVGTLGNLRIQLTTTSTSTTSGALQVLGGVGISGNLNVGSNVAFSATPNSNVASASPVTVNGSLGVKGNIVSNASVVFGNTSGGYGASMVFNPVANSIDFYFG